MNIPADGQWLWRFNTRSPSETARRWIQTRKFNVTLPHKINESVEEYLAAIEESQIKEWEFWEELEGDTPLGGELRVTHRTKNDSDLK